MGVRRAWAQGRTQPVGQREGDMQARDHQGQQGALLWCKEARHQARGWAPVQGRLSSCGAIWLV